MEINANQLREFQLIVSDEYHGHWSSHHATEGAYYFLVRFDHEIPLPSAIARDRN